MILLLLHDVIWFDDWFFSLLFGWCVMSDPSGGLCPENNNNNGSVCFGSTDCAVRSSQPINKNYLSCRKRCAVRVHCAGSTSSDQMYSAQKKSVFRINFIWKFIQPPAAAASGVCECSGVILAWHRPHSIRSNDLHSRIRMNYSTINSI